MIECVLNISEGRHLDAVARVAQAGGAGLLDVHTDEDHHRSVLTLAGEDAARAVAAAAVLTLDLTNHDGVHPRIGVADVVPFVPLGSSTLADAVAARDRFARWAGDELAVPCFCYGPERTLPEVRAHAFAELAPTFGPPHPHPTAGAMAVGARPVLVAYNLWLADATLEVARAIARSLRGPAVRALGLPVGEAVQVSMNLIDPTSVGPDEVYRRVATLATIDHAELVGLVPQAVLDATEPSAWDRLDLAPDRTIEARLEARGLRLD